MKKSHWNYRILGNYNESGNPYYWITEVHYENGKPTSYADFGNKGVGVNGYDLNDLWFTVKAMRRAFKKPILSGDKFPEKFADNPYKK